MANSQVDFETIWQRWVVPLRGRTIAGLNGLQNTIVDVDGNGVVRISRNGRKSRIPIAPFRWAVAQILESGAVARQDINLEFPHRYSSGVQLVLEQVPIFVALGRPAEIRLRPNWKSEISSER